MSSSLHKNAHKTLYITLNLGCSGSCKDCLTRGLSSCSRLTIQETIDWNKLRDVVCTSRAENVILIGGESPLYHSEGHRTIYYRIDDIVRPRKKLYALTTLKGLLENRNTVVLSHFDKLFVYIPELELGGSTSFFWTSGSTEVNTIIRPGVELNTACLNKLRVCRYPSPTIVVERTDVTKIPELIRMNGDFNFISENSIFNWQSPVYNLMTGEYKLHMASDRSEKKNRPWRELVK